MSDVSVTVSGNTREEALAEGLEQLGVPQELVDVEILTDAHEDTLPGAEPLPGVTLRLTVKSSVVVNSAREHLRRVLELIGVNARIEVLTRPHGTVLNILGGNDGALIIGKNGQNLDALQYLIVRMALKSNRDLLPIHVDSEGYKEKRLSNLEQMARRAADRARRTKREVALRPMPPADRRIIHMVLKNYRGVHTLSRGEEGRRHVVVTPEMGELGDGRSRHLKPRARARHDDERSPSDRGDGTSRDPGMDPGLEDGPGEY